MSQYVLRLAGTFEISMQGDINRVDPLVLLDQALRSGQAVLVGARIEQASEVIDGTITWRGPAESPVSTRGVPTK